MTDGELSLQLLKRQVELKLLVNPSNKDLLWAKEKIEDAIYKGVHTISKGWFTGFLSDGKQAVAQKIVEASNRFAPASSFQILRDRDTALKGTDPIGQLEMLDCSNVQRYRIVRFEGGRPIQEETQEWKNCQFSAERDKQNTFRGALNQHFEKGSALPLYEFVSQDELVKTNLRDPMAAAKIINHKRSITDVSQLTAVARDNMRAWQRNGIIAQGIQKGLGAKDPEFLIQELQNNPTSGSYDEQGRRISGISGINEPISLLMTAIIIAVSAVAFAGIVQVFKGEEPTAFRYLGEVLGEGTKAIGTDWANRNPNNDDDDDDPNPGGGGTPPNPGDGGGDTPKDNTGLIAGAAILAGVLLMNKNS
jgi:hypothetical protein